MEETATQTSPLARAVALGNLVLEPDHPGLSTASEHESPAIEPLEGARSTDSLAREHRVGSLGLPPTDEAVPSLELGSRSPWPPTRPLSVSAAPRLRLPSLVPLDDGLEPGEHLLPVAPRVLSRFGTRVVVLAQP